MKYNITKKLKTAQQDAGVANFLNETIGMSPGGSKGSGNVGGSGGSGSSNVKLSTPEPKATGSNTTGSNDKLSQIITNNGHSIKFNSKVVNIKNNKVHTNTNSYEYDILINCTGSASFD